jgi:C4-dicarboxylate transporter DctM subunit
MRALVANYLSPVHFGVIMVVNLCIGFVTPPLGANLFVITQIADIPYGTLCRSIAPWLVIMISALFLITYIEAIPMGLVWFFRGDVIIGNYGLLFWS